METSYLLLIVTLSRRRGSLRHGLHCTQSFSCTTPPVGKDSFPSSRAAHLILPSAQPPVQEMHLRNLSQGFARPSSTGICPGAEQEFSEYLLIELG